MNLRKSSVAAVLSVGAALFALSRPALAETLSPPAVIHFCAANCSALVLKGGQYEREDGTAETWTIEQFSSDAVVLHRHDPPLPWNGYKTDVLYAGKAVNDRLAGLTVAGDAAPTMTMAWGSALASVPANNAERDNPASRRTATAMRMHMSLANAAGTGVRRPDVPASNPSNPAPANPLPPPALPAAATGSGAAITAIHVLTGGAGINTAELITYAPDGRVIPPHIALGQHQSYAMAADANDELYISHNSVMDFVVAAYRPDGTQDPRFRPIPAEVRALAVSPAGNLYVLERLSPLHAPSTNGIVREFAPDGRSIGAPIDTHIADPTSLAVDAAGTLYVAGERENVIETFDTNGRRLALTIHDGIARPLWMAVDQAGKIYVVNANTNTLTTYTHDGQRTTPTITSFNAPAFGVALDPAGNIYVGVGRQLGLYSPTGTFIKYFAEIPGSPRGLALH